jgi:hypothetical protein
MDNIIKAKTFSDKLKATIFFIFQSTVLLLVVIATDLVVYTMCKQYTHLNQNVVTILLILSTLIMIWMLISTLMVFRTEGTEIISKRG